MALKFYIDFQNAQGDDCRVNFLFEDYNDAPIQLYGGAQPFVLGEFNTDADLFKSMRPQQATIQVLASAGGVELEDFLTDNDTDITVSLTFGTFGTYWQGILSQEDIEETWISTNHILILRADEGFGRLQTQQLNDGTGAALIGTYTPFNLIQYAADPVVGNFFYTRIYSNLLHTSMSSAANQTGIDQCLIDARTFEQSPREFDNGYDVIDKINRSWSQTLFQWNGQWIILRIPELFTDGNLTGFNTNRPTVGSRAAVNKRYDVEVGAREDVKPIAPEMLKTVAKPSKLTTVNFDWVQHEQVACNESFVYGDFIETTGTIPNQTDRFTVDSWSFLKIPISTPSSASGTFRREVVYANYQVQDDYVVLSKDATNVSTFARSCDIYVTAGDEFNFDIQYSLKQNVGSTRLDAIAFVQLYGSDGTYYTLDEDGKWYQSNASWSTNFRLLQVTFASGDGEDWATFEVSSSVPKSGHLQLSMYKDAASPVANVYFRDLNINILPFVQKFRRRLIKGDYDRYTIDKQITKESSETIFLDDSDNGNYKGSIKELDGITLTNDEWYRRKDFNGDVATDERLTFKRQHALAKWFMNRSYKTKLDVNFFGLKWKDISDVEYPIGLINTIKFVDDAPSKIFAIANLKEIDFMNCTWSASLVEVFDTDVADNEPGATDVHTFDYYYE